jgi:RNA polymerase sigma factor (sigma-70 family)
MDDEFLASEFEGHRAHLRAVAYRMLGSSAEAEDAVQEAWLRLHRTDAETIDNLGGWLTTVVARVSLSMLRSRRTRREDPWDDSDGAGRVTPDRSVGLGPAHAAGAGSVEVPGARSAPESEALLADSLGAALLVVLDTLTPAERLAFVLHDLFGMPFEEIAPIVDRSPAAARQLASRARRRVQGSDEGRGSSAGGLSTGLSTGGSSSGASSSGVGRSGTGPSAGSDATAKAARERQARVVRAFLAASRNGEFGALLELLDPDVVLRADAAAVQMGAEGEVLGADAVARTFSGRAKGAVAMLVDGVPAAVWSLQGTPKVVFEFAVEDDVVVGITMRADPEGLARLALARLP